MTTQPAVDRAAANLANREGMQALHAGDHAAAARAFARAVAADPASVDLLGNLAHACRMAGDAKGEMSALNAALALDRIHFPSQLRLAQLHQRLGEEIPAITAWSGALQLAAQQENLLPEIHEQLAAGRAYCESLRGHLGSRIGTTLAGLSGEWSETEHRRINAFVDGSLGRRKTFHNVCEGVFYPFLPADEYFDLCHFPWLAELESAFPDIREEFEQLYSAPAGELRPYVSMEPGTPLNKWSPLDNSLDWSAAFLWKFGERNPAVADRCPKTASLCERMPLARIPGRAPNVFFSLLAPHSHIPPHTGVTNTRAIIHLALRVPENCRFRVGGETRPWIEGKAFAFDDTIEHEAWNESDSLRAVLIIDCWNPHLSAHEQGAITAYFATSDSALTQEAIVR